MFLFYFAVLAEVTPPVALSAYAASSVMGTDPIKTGVFAARVALPKYFIGLTFILSFSGTALLILPVLQTMHGFEAFCFIAIRFLFSIMAVIYLNVAVVGYLLKPLPNLERIITGICAILLFYPDVNMNLVAGVISSVIIIKNLMANKKI